MMKRRPYKQKALRHTKTEEISSSIERMFKNLGLDVKYKEVKLINSWETIMGKTIAQETEYINIKGKCLFLKIRSSILRSELSMMKQSLLQTLNRHAGEEIINKIIIK